MRGTITHNKISIRALFLLLCCSGSSAGIALADGSEELALLYGDEESVSIATGTAKLLHLAPSVASVITADEIEQMGLTTLDEALALVPGLYPGISPFNRLNPNWSIRGISSDQTPQVLLLRDGVPLIHFFHGSRPNLFRLPLAGVERIEVIRGPGSAVYGADAFAGVINVITKRPADIDSRTAGARIGSFERRDAWLQFSDHLGGWDTALNLEYSHSDGDSDRVVGSDLQSVFDGLFGTDASRAPGPLATGYELLNTNLRLVNGPLDIDLWHWRLINGGLGAGGAQALDPVGSEDLDQSQINVRYRLPGSRVWQSDLQLSYWIKNDYPKFVLFPAGTRLPIGTDGNIGTSPLGGLVTFPDGVFGQPDSEAHFAELQWVNQYSGFHNHQLRIGAGFKYEREDTSERKNFGPHVIDGSEGVVDGSLTDVSDTPYVYMPDQQRRVQYLSLQDVWHFAPDWELTAGLRYDHYSDFGDTVNPRLALVWSMRYDLTGKLMYGRAFRAPSFGELYAQNNPVVLGNPDLSPETIDSLELAFDYRPTQQLATRLNLYHYEIADLIDYLPDAGGQTSTAQNVQDRTGQGLELELEWRPHPQWQLYASYAWQHSEDSHSGEDVPNTPAQMASLRALWTPAPEWSLAAQAWWVADMQRESADTRAPLQDYTLTDLTLRHRLSDDRFSLALKVSNLFDQDARAPTLYNPGIGTAAIAEDYPLPGRAFWLELQYRM